MDLGMELASIVFGVAAGVGFCAGAMYLVIGLSRRPRNLGHVTFGVLGIACALFALAVTALYSAQPLANAPSLVVRSVHLSRLLVVIALLGFVAACTRFGSRRWLWLMSAWFAAAVALTLISPSSASFDAAPASPWRLFGAIYIGAVFLFCALALLSQSRRGERRQAAVLGACLAVCLAALALDWLIDLGVLSFIHLGELAFAGLVATMGISLALGLSTAESKAVTGERRLRAFFQNARQPIWAVDLDPPIDLTMSPAAQFEQLIRNHARYSECNDAMLKLHGFDRSEDLPNPSIFRWFPLTEEPNVSSVRQAVESGYGLGSYETMIVDRHGARLPTETSIVCVVEEGKLVRVWGITEEMAVPQNAQAELAIYREQLNQARAYLAQATAERKRAEAGLADCERRYQTLLERTPNGIMVLEAIDDGKDFLITDLASNGERMPDLYTANTADAAGMRLLSVLPGVAGTGLSERLRRVWQTGEPEYIPSTNYGDPSQSGIWRESWLCRLRGGSVAMVYVDVSAREQVESALRLKLEQLVALNDIALATANVLDIRQTLERVASVTRRVFDARFARIYLPDGQIIGLPSLIGNSREIIPADVTDTTELDLSIGRWGLERGQSAILSAADMNDLPPEVQTLLSSQNLCNLILAPLTSRDRISGLLFVGTDQARCAFSEDDLTLAETIAHDIVGAIEYATWYQKAKSLAASEERNRIARDLHDAVTQTIYSASLIAEVLPNVWRRDAAEGLRNLKTLRILVRGALAELRTMLVELRPAALEAAVLSVLVGQLSDVLTGQTRIPVEQVISGEATLPSSVKIALYRIAQEIFNNIAKHSGATKAQVQLRQSEDRIELMIRDNGVGFDRAHALSDRMGLRIMQERADQIGARLDIASSPGKGATITVQWAAQQPNQSQNGGQLE